ncbi:MAG TPA: serine hydrolase [Desulfobacterales bacterium]|nr:serine hydrolase [Desulfobacterales bacterium]
MLMTAAGPAGSAQPQPFLPESCDPRLQQGLENCIAALRLNEAVRTRNLSVVLVDITDPECPRLAYANPNHMMYAASLPKIAILLAAFERIDRGEMELDAPTLEKLKQMIRRSSNDAATEMLNRVGQDFLLEVLQSPRYRLYDPEADGGLWVGKEYSKSSARRRDPLHHLSHGATALQVARFYYLLETGQLVSPEHSRTMKAILGNPEINHKFVKGLKSLHPDSTIYRKSGTWQDFHCDSALIEHEGHRYIAVALSQSPVGGRWLSELIVAMDNLICRPESVTPDDPTRVASMADVRRRSNYPPRTSSGSVE